MKKSVLYTILTIVFLIGVISFLSVRNNKLQKKYEIAVQNNKAYADQLDVMNTENHVFRMTIDQLRYINDSTIQELEDARKELKIKDSKIKQMGKIKEYVYINDTVRIHDTIFKDEDFVLDTVLGDEWYQNNLHMQYPNVISSSITINTDQNVFLHTSRETIEPPCKTWLGRLFQEKHDVYNVTVVEKNPYATVKENKFIIIQD